MNGLYGLSDCEPGGGTMSLPMSARQLLFSSSVSISHADSKHENILALSSEYIFSAPTASTTSAAPARNCITARLNAALDDAHAPSTL
jgi:hypothetical protein